MNSDCGHSDYYGYVVYEQCLWAHRMSTYFYLTKESLGFHLCTLCNLRIVKMDIFIWTVLMDILSMCMNTFCGDMLCLYTIFI